MLHLTLLRTLTLAGPTQAGRPAYISAASGLVHVGGKLYVVADDENYLGIFPDNSDAHGTLKQLFAQVLPLGKNERKAEKPDLEVVTFVPANDKYPYGALLMLGSGSAVHRCRGALIALDADGQPGRHIEPLDLTLIYRQISKRVDDLNIEGAVVMGSDIVLFQRGNNVNYNASIRCRTEAFLSVPNDDYGQLAFFMRRYDLGEIDGVPLCFTDAAALPDGSIVFTAVAEDTADAYLDGKCLGSAVGIINREGELSKVVIVDKQVKLEGISATFVDNTIQLLMVTDADDVTVPAEVYSAVLSV